MEELARTNLFFIDSRTSSDTVAERTANQFKVTSSHRNVFLDHVRTRPAIEFQFDHLLQVARQKGAAITIGHPYPEILAVLEQRIIAAAREKELLKKASTLTHNTRNETETTLITN